HEVDVDSLTTTPVFKSSNLAALRYARTLAGPDQRVLAEVSNAKSSKATVANSAFKYALGMDQKIGNTGLWLELRVGRKRTHDDAKDETVSLVNLNWSFDAPPPLKAP